METKNARIDRIVSYLDAIGVKDIDIEKNYNSRVVVQKVAFIMDTMVGELKYPDFTFHIKGPYSHTLTVEYFGHKDAFRSAPAHRLNARETAITDKIKSVINVSSDIESLEILASLLYLRKISGLGEDEAEQKLHELKPHLSWESIYIGTNNLKILLLTKERSKELMVGLEKETAEWDRLSNEALAKFV